MRLLLSLVLGVGLIATNVYAEEQAALKSQKEKLSYSIGVDIGTKIKKQSIDVDPDILSKGLKDGYSEGQTLMTEAEMLETLEAFKKEMMAKQMERQKQQEEKNKLAGEKNKKDGEAFLAENKKKEGVVTLPSGLQYKIIKEGTGKSPKATDTVTTHYKGTLIDGTEFDSSYKRGEPASFPVSGVIPGWTEALQLMKEGSKWQLFVPSNIAYGDRGAGSIIGPNSTLIFEVELISVKEGTSPHQGH
jgi:FKBP-type peptidyl-prolyl cis-trans isomerase FklB